MTTTEVLEEVTREVLAQMVAAGYPPDVCAWDINAGWCDVWADVAQARVGGTAVWLDDTLALERLTGDLELAVDVSDCGHCVLYLDARWYDAQCVVGTTDLRTLTVRVPREAWLAEARAQNLKT